MNITLKNRTALICGSSKGIGKAIADRFAEMGATLVLIARNNEALTEFSEELKSKYNSTVYCYSLDLNNLQQLEKVISEHLSKIGNIDILVNNSGGPPAGKLLNSEIEDFISPFQSHLFASHKLVRLLSESMKQKNFGRIINIISVSVKQPIENLGISNTLRGAMASWAKTLSREFAPYNITVNNILPGYTNTERLDELFTQRAIAEDKSLAEITEQIITKIPANRLGKPEEIADYAGFLASDNAEYINGTSLAIDGGFLSCL